MDEKNKKVLIGHMDQFTKKLGNLTDFFEKFKDDYKELDSGEVGKFKDDIEKIITHINSVTFDRKMMFEQGLKENIIKVFNDIDKNMQIIIDNIELYKTLKTNYDLQRVYFILNRIMKKDHNKDDLNRIETDMKEQLTKIKNAINSIDESIKHIKSFILQMKSALNIKLDKSHIEVTSKVFPTPFVNSKGFRIGDYKVAIDTTALPFTNTDQVNHYLYNLFDYTSYQGIPKMTRKQERGIDSFFSAKKTKLEAYNPIKYPDPKKAKYIEKEQKILQEENRKIRENMRKIQDELAEMGISGNPEKRDEIRKAIEEEIGGDDNKKESILSEYLNAIDEVERGDEGFKLPYLTAPGDPKNKVVAGGKRKTRGNQRKKRTTHKRNVTKRRR
jgi:hypothetical protein